MRKTKDKTVNEDVASDNAASIQAMPSAATTKLGAIAGVVDCLAQLSQEQAINFLNVVLQSIGQEAANIPDDAAKKNLMSISAKPSAAEGMREAIEADIESIFGGDTPLSEEFKEKAITLFEAAVNLKTRVIEEELNEKYEAAAMEQLAELEEELIDKLDAYVTHAAESWLNENEVAIESTLRNEVTEEFIEGLKDLFESHYIDVPEDKLDVVEELSTKLEEAYEEINNVMNENIQLKNTLSEDVKDEVIDRLSEGLTGLQKAKLKTLSEGIEFNSENFESKMKILKEGFVTSKKPKFSDNLLQEEFIESEADKPVVTGEMKRYVDVLSAMTKKR